jgi:peptidase S41-like protein
MRRSLLAILAAAVVVAGGASGRARPASSTAGDDVRLEMSRIRAVHPDPFHATPEPVFQAAADDLAARADGLTQDQLLVSLMRFTTLLGERDGHSGIFPLDSAHRRVLHLFPLYLYDFSDGLFVVAAPGHPELVGSKLLSMDGIDATTLKRDVWPLVPRDNDSTREDRFMSFMLAAEVLHGLGLRSGIGPAAFTLQKPGAAARVVNLAPVAARTYLRLMRPSFPSFVYALPKRPKPLYLRRRGEDHYVTTIDHGRVVFVGYNQTLGSTATDAQRVLRLAKQRKVRRVVVDVRLNPGGDNHTYAALLQALRSRWVDRAGRLVVLISRSTFSAAENFIADLERHTKAVFVGEDSGGSPNLYGDVTAVALPTAGVSVNIATQYWQKSVADDPRVTIEPDVRVPLGSRAFFRGGDPVLAAALAYRRR